MKNKLVTLVLAVAVIASLVIAGCAEPAPAPSPQPTPSPSPEPSPAPAPSGPAEILVGCSASVTGMYAGMADGGAFGQRAAVDDINKQGGVYVKDYDRKLPIRLIVVNNESDPIKAGVLAEDLVLREKVNFLTCHNEPPPMHAPVATIAARYGIPHIANVAVMEPWLAMRAEVEPAWAYSHTMGFAIATPAAAGSIWDKPGYTISDTWKEQLDLFGDQTNKKVGVFTTDDPDGIAWYAIFPPMLEGWGYDVVGEDKKLGLFPIGTTDFTSIINEWKKNDVEILWGNCPAPDFGTLWRQCHELDFQPRIVTAGRAALYYTDVTAWGGNLPAGIGTETFWQPSIEGCPGIGGTTSMNLYERWVDETGRPLSTAIGLGYTVIQVLIDAIERAGTLDADKVNEAAGETDLMTIYHRVKFDPETQFSRQPIVFGQWQKTDKPEVWKCEITFSKHDFLPETAEFLFPVPYD
jgi:branched-chain amino acid transport system substrate-binding protein